MKKNLETTQSEKFGCEFCGREFIRESTMFKHLCENKRRWQDRERIGNRLGFQTWVQFYEKHTATKKKRTYLDFAKSSYYLAFVKFGSYCAEAKVINVSSYVNWLLSEKVRIDSWMQDTNYTKFLISYMKTEDPMDAVARSIENVIEYAKEEKILSKDYFRYGNKNKICYAITTGKISPWMLFQSESGIQFLDKLDNTQQKMIIDYINPEQWAIKFNRNSETVKTVKELLKAGGF